jgi:hypothetical protein
VLLQQIVTTFMTENHGHGGGREMEPLPLLLQSILAVPQFEVGTLITETPAVLSMCDTLQKLFSHASSVILLFSNPAPKTKNWDCKPGARLLIAKHVDESL